MSKREIVKMVLDGERPPYVPWNVGLTKEAREKLQKHFGHSDMETALHNHFLRLGSDIGFFTDLGGDQAPLKPEQGADTPVWLATLVDSGPTGGFFRERQPIPW
jgi:hypothetical protein